MHSYFKSDYYQSIKFYAILLLEVLVTITAVSVATLGLAAGELILPERLVTMFSLKTGSGPDQLVIVSRTEAQDEAQERYIQQVKAGAGGALTTSDRKPLPASIAAYARCPAGSGSDLLLGLGASGVTDMNTGAQLVSHPTLFAHRAKDLFPEFPICFDLFGDERPAIVIPVLQGLTIFRWNKKSAAYEQHAEIAVRANSRFFWQVVDQDSDDVARQNASISLDFPDNFITDFNGDGRKDMCFAYGESVQCVLQAKNGFKGAQRSRFNFDILTATEKDDSSIRIRNRLLDINGDRLADLVLQKTVWNITSMETTLYIYLNKAVTGFKGVADQTIRRSGYFAYHDFIDLSGDGLPELISPVADMNFADMVRILVSRTVSIDNIVYSNKQGVFSPKATSVFSHIFPVNFRNAASLSSALPVWNVRIGKTNPKNSINGLFFPDKTKIAAVEFPKSGIADSHVVWTRDAEIGDAIVVLDLDGDGVDELWTGWPRVSEKSKRILRTILQ